MSKHEHTDQVRAHAETIVAEQLDHPEGAYPSEISAATSRHVADAQLIEALLRHHYPSPADSEARERRIDQVLGALASEPVEAPVTHAGAERDPVTHRPARRSRRRWRIAPLSAMLLLFVTASVWWIATPATSAASTLDFVIAAADRAEDRTYSVTIESRAGAPIQFHQETRLDVRGRDHFVMRRATPLGRDIIFGSNGSQSWIISPLGTVTRHEGPELLDRWRTRREAVLPFHNVSEALTFLDSKYDLEIVDATMQLDTFEGDVIHLSGRRAVDAGLGPTHADIWCDARTGSLLRLVLILPSEWSPSGHAARVTFDLESTDSLPDDWFEPEAQVTQ